MADENKKEAGQSAKAYQLQADETFWGEGSNFINAEEAELSFEGLAESSKSEEILKFHASMARAPGGMP